MKSSAPIRIVEGTHTASLIGQNLPIESRDTTARRPPMSRRSRLQSWVTRFTHPRSCIAVVSVSVALLAYSAFTHAQIKHPHSRPLRDMSAHALAGGRAPEPSMLDSLRTDAAKAQDRLLSRRFELRSVLESIELAATRKGWKVDLTLPSPLAAPGGWTNLVGYPASLHLTPAHPDSSPSFASVIEWLEEISRLPKHIEIAQLTIDRSSPQHLSVRAGLLVLAQLENAEAPPE